MIRAEPLTGWRVWRVDLRERLLESCFYGDRWPPRQAFAARCPKHDRPQTSCECGVYALTDRTAALELARWAQTALEQPIVIGRIYLWGRVLPYSLGYRAELAYPFELGVLASPTLGEQPRQAIARALRERYVAEPLADC